MSLGKRRLQGGDFTPIVKFDARQGHVYKVDRDQRDGQWQTVMTDISDDFQAVIDLDNVKVGWMQFTTSGPDFRLVALGQDIGDRPSDAYKEGFKVRLALRNGSNAYDDVRELASTARVVWDALSELHDEFLQGRTKAGNRGKLPIVGIRNLVTLHVSRGSKVYQPCFEIRAWVSRPQGL